MTSQGLHFPALFKTSSLPPGVRDLEKKERAALRQNKIRVFTMRDIDEMGISSIMQETLTYLHHVTRLHVSLDMDSIDPMTAPGVGTPAPGGLTYREAHLIMEIIADSQRMCSMDIVEINPLVDSGNQTANIAVDLVVSVFGKSII